MLLRLQVVIKHSRGLVQAMLRALNAVCGARAIRYAACSLHADYGCQMYNSLDRVLLVRVMTQHPHAVKKWTTNWLEAKPEPPWRVLPDHRYVSCQPSIDKGMHVGCSRSGAAHDRYKAHQHHRCRLQSPEAYEIASQCFESTQSGAHGLCKGLRGKTLTNEGTDQQALGDHDDDAQPFVHHLASIVALELREEASQAGVNSDGAGQLVQARDDLMRGAGGHMVVCCL